MTAVTNSDELVDWPRTHYTAGGEAARFQFVAFGNFDGALEISRSTYRTAGVPDFVDVSIHSRLEEEDLLESFLEGYAGEWLRVNDPAMHSTIRLCDNCFIVKAVIPDPKNLNYMRDVIGILMAMMDQRGVCILDCTSMRWIRPDEWREKVFSASKIAVPHLINTIMTKDTSGPGWWVSTRGLRKFGRPDISFRNVPKPAAEAVVDVCNRMATMFAMGALVAEGKVLKIATIPGDIVCHLTGSESDPDFQNTIVEIKYPREPVKPMTPAMRAQANAAASASAPAQSFAR